MIEEPGILRGDEFVTAAALDERSRRAATALRAIGVEAGDTVALLLRNDHAIFEATFAAGITGAAPVPVNWHGAPDEVLYVIADSHAKLLVAHADLVRPLLGSLPDGLEVRVVPTPPDIGSAYGIAEAAWAVPQGATAWSAWIEGFEPWAAAPRAAPAAVLYTSGTTGKPKGVRRASTNETDRQRSPYFAELARASGFDPAPRAVVTGPLYHGAPFAWGMAWARLRGLVVLQPRFDAEELLRTIEAERITHLLLVPIMFTRILKLPAEVRARYDVSSLRYVSHGAAPCPRHVKEQMIACWGPIIHELYGSAEIGVVTWATAEEWLAHPGTVGRALAGVELRILDEAGEVLPTGEVGEIYTRVVDLPQFTYEGRPEAAAEVARDGFLSAGDIGYLDGDGFLYLCDRKKDMVISGGVNIYPIEIEECILSLPGVRDVAVFGIPDDEYGESLGAAIEVDEPGLLTADDVRAHVRANLAAFKAPRVVEFHDALPREDSGKVFKRTLRDAHWAGAGRTI